MRNEQGEQLRLSQVKRFKLCEPEALSILITDSGLSEEKIMEYREKGIKVILCD